MKPYYFLIRWTVIGIVAIFSMYQQYCWYVNGIMMPASWVASVVWFIVLIGGTAALMFSLCPVQNPKVRHKFKCTFYGIHGVQRRICTRNYDSIWTFCFAQMKRSKSLFFTVALLDDVEVAEDIVNRAYNKAYDNNK